MSGNFSPAISCPAISRTSFSAPPPLPDHPRRVTFSEEAQALQQSRRPPSVFTFCAAQAYNVAACGRSGGRLGLAACVGTTAATARRTPTHLSGRLSPHRHTRHDKTVRSVSSVAPLLRRIGCVWCLGGLCSASSPCLSTAVYNDEPPIGVILGDTVGTRTTPLFQLGGTVPSTFKHYTLKRYKSSYMSYTT